MIRDERREERGGGEWRDELTRAFRDVDALPPGLLHGDDPARVREAARRFPMVITPYYLSLIDSCDPSDPLRRMAIPAARELDRAAGLSRDPIDEERHSPCPGLIRRYPDRALLLVSSACALGCRHCTRRHLSRGHLVSLDGPGLDRALGFIAGRPEIRDVILSGGDPLLLEDDALERILVRVRAIPTVEIVRVGTRVPVTLPSRVTKELAELLGRFHPLYVNTQFNHPREITPAAAAAVRLLVEAGIPVGNQSVLLKGVNDAPETMEELCRGLLRIRVRPYYLFLCDLWEGLGHLRAPLRVGVEIMEHLRGRLSGIGIPTLVADLSGGLGKVPVEPSRVVRGPSGEILVRAPNGDLVPYPD